MHETGPLPALSRDMRSLRHFILVVTATLTWSITTVSAEPGRLVSSELGKAWTARHDRIQEKILARQRVRPPSASTVQKLLADPANQAAARSGSDQLKALNRAVTSGGAKRGVRRGYSGTEVEYSGRGLASRLGLRAGQSTTWATMGAVLEVKAENAGRVVLKVRRHDVFMQALRGAVDTIVAKLAADPTATLTVKEELRLAMAPADLRAEALADHGFKLARQAQATGLKYRLQVTGDRQTRVFARVFGPAMSTYLPGGHHSQYIHSGRIFDTYFAELDMSLRPTNRTVYPVTLGVREAQRLDTLAAAVVSGDSYVQGTTYASSRPPGYWPPRPGTDCKSGNSCTTTHHRAPIGNRNASNAWLDELERAQAGSPSLLEQVGSKQGPARLQRIDQLVADPATSARQRELLGRLRPIVESYNTIGLSQFPLTLLGRAQLKDLLGVSFDPTRAGTTDPVGPGLAKPFYGSAPNRIPVIVELHRDATGGRKDKY
jgi:hypothetical protein